MRPNPNLIPRFNVDYNFEDFIYSIKSIFSNQNPNIKTLESIFGKKNFFFTNSGRSALYILLKAMSLPKDSEVGVPLYSCPVVWEAIVRAGYKPKFIDIDPYTYTMDIKDLEQKVKKLRALVVIHTFGHPADMDEIMRIANGIPIIEDCAHSLLSEYKNKKTGLFGDASIFTFGNGKYISAGGGGMILVNKNELIEKIREDMDSLIAPTLLQDTLNSIKSYVHSFLYHRPWFGGIALPFGSLLDKNNISGKTNFKVAKIGKGNMAVFLKKLVVFEEHVKKQRENSEVLIRDLSMTNMKLFYQRGSVYCTYFLFPIRFPNKERRDDACELFRIKGIDSAKYWETYPIAKLAYEYKGDCPNTEQVAKTLATIANYYTLSNKDLSKIINVCRSLA